MRVSAELIAADADARTLTGRLLPWNTPGRTSRGEVLFAAASLAVPDVPADVVLNTDHDPLAPIGRLVAAHDDGTALVATFAVDAGPRGDQALLDAQSGLRAGLSVECSGLTIADRVITAARLVGAGLVSRAAFPGAGVIELTAAEADDVQPPAPVPALTDPAPPYPVAVPLPATAPIGAPRMVTTEPRPPAMADLYAALTAKATGQPLTPELTAALADITNTANAWVDAQAYAGQLWSGIAYERAIVPLIASQTLTSYKVTGWRWLVAPVVATWAGDKAAVPSNAATTEAVNLTAKRLAGAHDIDRKFRDFGDTAFFAAYYEAMTESYARLSDAAALADLIAGATAATGVGTDPVARLWSVYLQLLPYGARPALVIGSTVLAALSTVTTAAAPGLDLPYNPLDLIVPSPLIAADAILGVQRDAAAFYELPGSPIRVEAVDMVKGGIDPGVFGYFATLVRQPKALVFDGAAGVGLSADAEAMLAGTEAEPEPDQAPTPTTKASK